MIKNKLHMLMAERRVKSVRVLADETKLGLPTLYRIYNGENERIDYNTLNVLCKHFNCSLSDLLEYVPDVKGE